MTRKKKSTLKDFFLLPLHNITKIPIIIFHSTNIIEQQQAIYIYIYSDL